MYLYIGWNDFGKLERKGFLNDLNINLVGSLLIAQAFYENVKKSSRKQILFMSTTLAGVGETKGNYGFDMGRVIYYRTSKSGLNMGMAALAHYGKKDGVQNTQKKKTKNRVGSINSVVPID